VKYLEWKCCGSSSSSSSNSSSDSNTGTMDNAGNDDDGTVRPWEGTWWGRGRTVVDLGAGTGITSLGMALMLSSPQAESPRDGRGEEGGQDGGSSLVVCTDGCGLVVRLAEENVRRVVRELHGCMDHGRVLGAVSLEDEVEGGAETGVGTTENTIIRNMIGACEIRVREYSWGDGSLRTELLSPKEGTDHKGARSASASAAKHDTNHHFDIILVSDCVLPKLYPIAPLVDAIDELAGPDTVAYISYEQRYYPEYDPKEYFTNLAEAKGFQLTVVPLEEQHPIYSVEDIEIWELRRRKED